MNRNPESFDASPTLNLDVKPVALHLPVGAAVFALRGTVWITQERLRDDIILGAGQRFDVKSRRLILASAVKNTAAIHIVQPAAARTHPHQDLHEFARARAQHLRHEEIARLANLVAAGASMWIMRVRAFLAPRPRAIGH